MVTDTKTNNLRIVLHQIYVSLYVEYVIKNPLSPAEHPGGVGVNCEMFELGVEQFVVSVAIRKYNVWTDSLHLPQTASLQN